MVAGMTKPQSFEDIASKIRQLARDPETRWSFGVLRQDGTVHSETEMDKDDINLPDMYCVLKGCRVTRAEWDVKWSEWRYRAEGKNLDGIPMVFIVTISEEEKGLGIVTAWTRKQPRG
jgi:hypothetical protein